MGAHVSWHVVQVLSSMAIGGQERVALDLSAGLLSRGHRVTALSFVAGGALADEFRRVGAEVRTVVKRPGLDGGLIGRLVAGLWQDGVDVVHTHNPQPLLYAAPAARILMAGAVVHTKHGANPDTRRRVLLRRGVARLCGAYVAVSDEIAEVARRVDHVTPPRLQVIRNGIDLSRFRPDPAARAAVRRELGLPEDAWVVGTVGRLAPEKAQGDLIDAFARLVAERPGGVNGHDNGHGPGQGPARSQHLLLIGDGAERPALTQQAAAVGPSVQLLGARRDVPRLLQALDVFCLCSVTEGLPLVIPEAMAVGLPVVSTAVGGIPSVVMEGETGLLVPPRAPAELSRCLRQLRDDPAQAARLGAAGRARALSHYSVVRMVDEYEALYARLLDIPMLQGAVAQPA